MPNFTTYLVVTRVWVVHNKQESLVTKEARFDTLAEARASVSNSALFTQAKIYAVFFFWNELVEVIRGTQTKADPIS